MKSVRPFFSLRPHFALAVGIWGLGMTASVSGEAVHSNQRPYSVTVAPGSTVFSDAVGFAFESDEADFSSFGLVGTGAPETIRTGTISLLFTADPGFAFTSASLDFDDIGWLNASFGGHYLHTGSWTISAGTYVGDASGSQEFGNANWFVTGQSGGFSYNNPFQGSSGGSGFGRDMMNGSFQLGGVTNFAVTMNTTATVSLTSEYYMNRFKVTAATAVVAIPEPSAFAVLTGAIALGLAAWRQWRCPCGLRAD